MVVSTRGTMRSFSNCNTSKTYDDFTKWAGVVKMRDWFCSDCRKYKHESEMVDDMTCIKCDEEMSKDGIQETLE